MLREMSDEPRDYDNEYTTSLGLNVRRRMGYSHERGHIHRFVVQLEYEIEPGEWVQIVRSDHGPDSEHGYDITADGVRLDVYREGGKLRSEDIFPPMQPNEAFTYAEDL
jgi:hypothetical protein